MWTDPARVIVERDRRITLDAVTFWIGELDRELVGLVAAAQGAQRARRSPPPSEPRQARTGLGA